MGIGILVEIALVLSLICNIIEYHKFTSVFYILEVSYLKYLLVEIGMPKKPGNSSLFHSITEVYILFFGFFALHVVAL